MAQNVSLWGASYPAVPQVVLPKTGGGTAIFTDVSDTTATAGDVLSSKAFYGADGTKKTGSVSSKAAATYNTNSSDQTIAAGQYLIVGDQEYKIIAVGTEAPVTLAGLGHCTIRFNNSETVDMPGSIHVEDKPMPAIGVGTEIKIVEK